MNRQHLRRSAQYGCLGALASLLVMTTSGPIEAGIDGTGRSYGTVQRIASIFLNGVHYDTDNATFIIDGEFGTLADIEVGDVVTIDGSVGADPSIGVAHVVTYDDAVQGPISAIDASSNVLTVLGQTVEVHVGTVFSASIPSRSAAGLRVGDHIEVSGLTTSDGDIEATHIRPSSDTNRLEVTAVVSNVDRARLTFTLSGLTVDYSQAQQLLGFPTGSITNGDRVEVRGSRLSAGGELLAETLELKGSLLGDGEARWAEVEGYVSDLSPSGAFELDGVRVVQDAATQFDGMTAEEFGNNLKVEVTGLVQANGSLLAELITLRRSHDVRVAGFVDAVDATQGTVEILGVTVTTDALTEFEDKTPQKVRYFSVGNIAIGDFVMARGMELPSGSGELRAESLTRDKVRDSVIRGYVEPGSTASDLRVLGVHIATNGRVTYRDVNGERLSAAEFFATLSDGDLISAEGREVSDNWLAAEDIDFESP